MVISVLYWTILVSPESPKSELLFFGWEITLKGKSLLGAVHTWCEIKNDVGLILQRCASTKRL